MKWFAYYNVEPFGVRMDFLRTGIEARTIAEIHRDPKKRARPYSADDFIPGIFKDTYLSRKDEERKPINEEGWNSFVKAMANYMGGKAPSPGESVVIGS